MMAQTNPRPVMRPSEIRQAVTEWADRGFAVTLDTRTGVINVTPPSAQPPGDPFDLVDMRA